MNWFMFYCWELGRCLWLLRAVNFKHRRPIPKSETYSHWVA